MTKEVIQKVFLLPDHLVGNDLLVLTLKHPRTGGDMICAIDPENKIYEIVHYKEEISSWFIGESVCNDGSLFFLTQVDPLFLILPFANKEPGKYCPLEDLLMDENFPNVHYLAKCCTKAELKNIFDSKDSSGYQVYCFNKQKTMHWIQQKAKILSKHLVRKDIDLSDGSKAFSLVSENLKTDDEILQYSCHLISEYLSSDFSDDLFSSFGILQKSPKVEKKSPEKALKKKNSSVKPEDDYSINFKGDATKSKQNAKLTAAQKQLMKVDKKGMKTISSFFAKKG